MPRTGSTPRLYVVDVSSYIFRAFHAIPPLANNQGMATNAVLGVTNMLLKLVNEERPDSIAIVFDSAGPTFRDRAFADYKANRRPTPPDLVPQLPYVRRVIEAFRLPCLEAKGVEADDVIATLVASFASPALEVVIVTGDKDLMQLVGPHVTLFDSMKNRRTGSAEVEKRFGVPPDKVVDIMGLAGDTIDNVPGVKGIGEKTAQMLIQAFGSLDGLLAGLDRLESSNIRGGRRIRELLEAQGSVARLSRELARLKNDVPLEITLDDLRPQAPDYPRLRELFHELGFDSKLPLIAPHEPAKSGITAWVESRSDLEMLASTLAGKSRVVLEPIEDRKAGRLAALAVAATEHEACVVLFDGNGGLRPADLAPWLAAAEPRKVGADLKRSAVILAREGVDVDGIDFDVCVASHAVNPSRRTHRVEDLALEYLGRNLVTGLDEREHAVEESAAERARSVLAIEGVLRDRLVEREAESLFRDIDMPLVSVLARMENRGVRVDRAVLDDLRAELESAYVDALLALVDPRTGRIHARFDQTAAATGRLSCTEPSLQSIANGGEPGRRIRAAFVAAGGHRLISADYS
ncbi:MAG: DNA polymerase, partial [Candidatus Binatia bacterium]